MAEDTHGMGIPLPADSTPIYQYPRIAREMGEKIAAILAGGMTEGMTEELQRSAGEAVIEALSDSGIMRGHASTWEDIGSAWRQITEQGYWLPLGYTKAGRLDDFARQIWREDVNHTISTARHPVYARAIVTEDNDLLLGITWAGRVVIPGLDAAAAATAKPAHVYNDTRYIPDSDVLPVYPNVAQWAGWGSSSMFLMHSHFSELAQAAGAAFYAGGKPSERSNQIAARLGSIPALLTFPGNRLPASGSTAVNSPTIPGADLLTYSGYVTDTAGNRIKGTLSDVGGVLTFTRTTAGTERTVAAGSEFIPDLGHKHRDAVTFLWMGKNNVWETQRVIDETNASFDYLAPLAKRCVVLGHFVNTGAAANDASRQPIAAINDAHRRRFGPAFIDVAAYLTSSRVWADTGITPTADDLAQQATGNKPPSLAADAGHLNAAGNQAIKALVQRTLAALGWTN